MFRGRTLWIAAFLAALFWSVYRPFDYTIWLLEVFPALIAAAVLWFTRDRFPLTRLAYVLILLHCILLMVGGHYTYAEVPLGEWIQQLFDQSRNNYDKLGHLAQGFVPAIVAREVFLRLGVIARHGWLSLITVSFCLAVSALYELIEWWVALISGEAADSFLGTQGYVWDTQSDMFLAMVGAILALLLLGRLHDRQIRALEAA